MKMNCTIIENNRELMLFDLDLTNIYEQFNPKKNEYK